MLCNKIATHIFDTCWMAYVLNVVSELSQGRDVLHGMLSYDVQDHFICKMFMALITLTIAVLDGAAHVVLGDFVC